MTDTIKTVLLNYAVCALVGGVLEFISPEKMKKILRVAVVSVMLFSVTAPFMSNEINFEEFMPEEVSEDVNYNALMHTANLTERQLKAEMKELLINEGINEYEIYVTTTVEEEEKTVYLDEIKIEVGKAFEDKTHIIKSKAPEEYQRVLSVGVKNG